MKPTLSDAGLEMMNKTRSTTKQIETTVNLQGLNLGFLWHIIRERTDELSDEKYKIWTYLRAHLSYMKNGWPSGFNQYN